MQRYTPEEVLRLLDCECHKAGGRRAFAYTHKVSEALISYTLTGARPLGKKILGILGLKKDDAKFVRVE